MKIKIEEIQPVAEELMGHCQQKMGFKEPPGMFFVDDEDNAADMFGKTAHYDPANKEVVVFITGRHPKDVLRSIAHELVHHMQNLRGDFDDDFDTSPGYAQTNPKLRKMEAEAYLLGNMIFRDWEDGIKTKRLQENKETKPMNNSELRNLVEKILLEKLKEAKSHPLDVAEPKTGKPDAKDFKALRDGAKAKDSKKDEKEDEKEAVDEQSKTDLPDRGAQRAQGGRRLDEEELEEEVKSQDDLPRSKEEAEEADEHGRKKDLKEDEQIDEASGRKNPHFDPFRQETLATDKEREAVDKKNAEQERIDREKRKKEEEINMSYYGTPYHPNDPRSGLEESETITTPEQENTLYESRFGGRNNRLFEKLLKKWAK